MRHKDTYFIKITDEDDSVYGLGEAGLFQGLSCDDRPDYEEKLNEVCREIDSYAQSPHQLAAYPSIRFAIETAIRDLSNGGNRLIIPSSWTEGKSEITINGLIWMGDAETMRQRIASKLAEGFRCIKVKIGGINFNEEVGLLELIRNEAPDVEIRLDANGAFNPTEALDKLDRLSNYRIHSIEQPIRAGQWDEMHRLCMESPIPIALDEELIGLNTAKRKIEMLSAIKPQFIILKPTLCGGIEGSEEWIRLAQEIGANWWATSALESNIGLNAIAQWVAGLESDMPQGLGTGQLYHNNIPSPLTLNGDKLAYDITSGWKLPEPEWH